MQNSFRPVALRLSLSDVAALAAATGRALAFRSRRDRPLAIRFCLRLKPARAIGQFAWTDAGASPATRCSSAAV